MVIASALMASQSPTHPKTEVQMEATHIRKITHTLTILQLAVFKVEDKPNQASHFKVIKAWRDQTRMTFRDTRLSDMLRSLKVMAISSLGIVVKVRRMAL